MSRSGPAERSFVVLLLVVFALLAATSMRGKNPTFDETAHLAAGVSYVKTGDYRMNPEHPALPKALAGAAAVAAGADMPAESSAWAKREQWDFGREVLYGEGVDWRRILFAGRLPMVVLGVLLGAVLWLWARAMIGGAGAAVALTLYAFSPNFLAHTRLVTTDVPLTLTVVGTAACLWAAWRTGRLGWTVAAAACVGLSMATKYSAFSFGPAWVLLALWPSAARPFRRSALHLGVLLVGSLVFTTLFVSASYGFAFDGVTIRSIGMAGRGIGPEQMGFLRRVPYEILASVPWPHRAFAEGLKDVLLYVEAGHPVYLLGQRAEAGWWWSPLLAFGVKAPLPFLLLALTSAVLFFRVRTLRRADLLFLAAPIALVFGTNVIAKLGLGVRHLMPAFPFLMLFAAWPLRGGGFRAGLVSMVVLVGLLAAQAVGTLRAHPDYLTYFHVAAGGPRGGYHLLGDSNLDWGQDLSRATASLKARGVDGAILCYFGTADPFAEDFAWQLMPPAPRAKARDPWTVLDSDPASPLWLAMSATNRQGIYYRGAGGNEGVPYPWLEGVEPAEVVGGSIFLYDITHEHDVQQGILEVYERHRLAEEGEALLRRLVARWKFDLESRRKLVARHEAREEWAEAEALILRTPNPMPEEVRRVANLRKKMGSHEGVIEAYEGSERAFPSDHESRNEFAWYLQETDGDLDRALMLVDESLRWLPDDPYYLDTKGMVLRKMGEPDEAIGVFETALARPDGDLAAIAWHRALALLEAGRVEEGLEAAEAVRIRPDIDPGLQEEVETWFWEREREPRR